MRSRSKESREGSRSKGKPPKNLLSGDNFRISKINLHSGSDVRLNHVRFRKSLLLEPSTLAQERAFMESQSPLKTSLSTTAARVKAALAITEDSSLLPKKNATVIVDRASTITPLNAFINVQSGSKIGPSGKRVQGSSTGACKDFEERSRAGASVRCKHPCQQHHRCKQLAH